MVRNFKYRLRLTKKQAAILQGHIEECRLLYNQLVCARVQAWESEQKSLSCYDQIKTLPLMKQQRPALKKIYSQVLQQVAMRVDRAFDGFFRRLKERAKTGEKAGFPRYKGINRYDSLTYPQFSNGCRLDNKGLRLGKIGCIRIVQHRCLEGVPKTCTIARTATGKWYASISCDIGDPVRSPDHPDTAVGIDVGLNALLLPVLVNACLILVFSGRKKRHSREHNASGTRLRKRCQRNVRRRAKLLREFTNGSETGATTLSTSKQEKSSIVMDS